MIAAQLAQIVLVALFCAILFGSAAAWKRIASRHRSAGRVLPVEPRRPVAWNFPVVVVVGVGALLLQGGMTGLMNWAGWFAGDASPERLQPALVGGASANILVVFLGGAALNSLGAPNQRLRIWGRRSNAVHDIGIGLVAFLAIAPPMYLLQFALVKLIPAQHPIIEQMLFEGADPQFFALAFVAAVIVAPVAEEFLFRGVLQGWLQSFEFAPPDAVNTPGTTLGPAAPLALPDETPPASAALAPIVSQRDPNPFAAPFARADETTSAGERTEPRELRGLFGLRPGVFPITVSSTMFAAAHIGQGPAPFTLFFLALALGYLYHRTNRLLPCIALHFFVNATSMTLLWLSLAAK